MIVPPAISISAHARPAWTVLAIPQDVDAGEGGDFATLRILDDRNTETPYILDPVLRDEPLAPRADDRILRAITSIDQRDGSTLITIDLGRAHHETSKIVIATSTPEFSRDVALYTSATGEEWRYAGAGRIERFAIGHPALAISLRERTRYVRVQISNSSNAPLGDLAADVYGPRHYVVFVAKPGRSYRIARAKSDDTPHYDLQTIMDHDHPDISPAHEKKAPRFDSVALNVAFGAVISVVLAMTLFTLRPKRS